MILQKTPTFAFTAALNSGHFSEALPPLQAEIEIIKANVAIISNIFFIVFFVFSDNKDNYLFNK